MCVFAALGIQQAMGMRHIVIVACTALQYFSKLFHKRHNFRKKNLTEHNSAHYSRQILMKLEFSPQIFEKLSNTKFHENPSSGSRGVPYGRTGGQTDRRINGQTDRHDEDNLM